MTNTFHTVYPSLDVGYVAGEKSEVYFVKMYLSSLVAKLSETYNL